MHTNCLAILSSGRAVSGITGKLRRLEFTLDHEWITGEARAGRYPKTEYGFCVHQECVAFVENVDGKPGPPKKKITDRCHLKIPVCFIQGDKRTF